MRVLLVDDHAVVRSGLARVLRAGGWDVVGEAGCSQQALGLAGSQDWDLVVLDAMLGEEDGVELARRLRSLFPRLPLMMLSMHSDPRLVRRAVQVGVQAFVVKDAAPEEVVAATLVARFRSLYLDPRVASAFLAGGAVEDRREAILDGLRRGLGNQEIAELTCLSPSSVKAELRALFAIYGVKDRNGLVRVLTLAL